MHRLANETAMRDATRHARGLGLSRREFLVSAAGTALTLGNIERRAGDLEAEQRALRAGYDELDRLGDRYFFPTVALCLADSLYRQPPEDYSEVEALCAIARERTTSEDLVNFVYLDAIEACLLARSERFDNAVALARRGLELAETSDLVDPTNKTRVLVAETLVLAGHSDEAAEVGASAASAAQAKGDVSGVAWIRRRLREVGVAVPE